jgi:hypothetical protein
MKQSEPIRMLVGDDENYLSDGLPLEEKEVIPERYSVSQIEKVKEPKEEKKLEKPKKSKRVEIVDVQVVDMNEEDEALLFQIENQHKVQAEQQPKVDSHLAEISELKEETEQSVKEELKLGLAEIKSSSEGDDDNDVGSPAINVIDDQNMMSRIIEPHKGNSQEVEEPMEVIPKIEDEHTNPDKFKDQEELEKYVHSDDNEDESKLNVHEIIDHPEHFKHSNDGDSHNGENGEEQGIDEFNNIAESSESPRIPMENIVSDNRGTISEVKSGLIDSASKHMSELKTSPLKDDPFLEERVIDSVNEPVGEPADEPIEEPIEEVKDTPKWNENGNFELEEEKTEKLEIEDEALKRLAKALDQADEVKKEGNDHFTAKEYDFAIVKYNQVYGFTKSIFESKAVLENDQNNEELQFLISKAKSLDRDVNSNLSIVYMKMEEWDKAIEKASDCLDIEHTSKAYFRRGKAYAMKGDFESALKDLNEGKTEFPNDANTYIEEIERIKELQNKSSD